jgi:hypothetical protein
MERKLALQAFNTVAGPRPSPSSARLMNRIAAAMTARDASPLSGDRLLAIINQALTGGSESTERAQLGPPTTPVWWWRLANQTTKVVKRTDTEVVSREGRVHSTQCDLQ